MLVAEPRDSRAILAESGGDQQRVVGATAEPHLDALLADADLGGSAHEAVEQLARPLALVPVPDATRQQAVQRARHQCELQVGVDLQRYGRGQRVHVEEVDRLSDRVLDHHAAGVAVDELGGLGVKLVGEQQRGLVVAEAGDRDLADRDGVVGQGDAAVEGGRVAVLAADVAQGQALPAFSGEQVADQLLGAAPQGQEADAKSLQAGQDGVGGEAGVEHQFARQLAGAFTVGRGEAQDSLVLVLLAHGGVGEAEDVLLGVADQEGEHAALAAAALGDEVLLQEGFVAVVGDGVEVEIERAAALDSEVAGGGEPVGSPAGYEAGVNAAGVLGKRGALGNGVEAGEQGEALVKGVGHEAGGATDAPELEGEQGAAGAGGGDGGGTGQATAADVGVEVELGEEGQEEEQAAEVGAEGARGEVEGVDGSGGGLDGAVGVVALVAGAAPEAGQASVFEDLGDGGDGGGQTFVLEALGDLVGGDVAGAELEDALAEAGLGVVGGSGLGGAAARQEEGAVGVLAEVGEDVAEGAGGVAEAAGGHGEREVLDAEGAQGFVAALVGVGGDEEAIGEVLHGN